MALTGGTRDFVQEIVRFALQRLHTQPRPGGRVLERLRQIDPQTAARLHPADEKRIVRALEVYAQTGKTLSQHDADSRAQPPRYEALWLGLDYEDRAVLYRRIDARVEQMLQLGLLGEVQELMQRGISPRATAMQAIGYKEFFAVAQGECTLQEAVALVKQRSRNYAKRQLTWLRRNAQLQWLRLTGEEDFDTIFAAARQKIPFFAG